MDDLSDLYQEIILSHNKRPRNEGELDPNSGEAEGYNPLCGDKIRVYVQQTESGLLDAVTFTGEGCAISRASASIMTDSVKGLDAAGIAEKVAEAIEMLTAKEEPEIDLTVMGDLAALVGVRHFPARIKCATLAWHTLESALKGGETVKTEEEG